MQQQTKIFIAAAVILVVLVFGYVWFLSRAKAPVIQSPTASSTQTATQIKPRSDVLVNSAQPTSTGKSLQLPTGFPTTIPVELGNITESFSAFYQTHNATQYTVTFTSAETVSAKWDEYSAYMTKAGYVMNKTATNKSKGTLSGSLAKDNLLIVITTENNKTTVHLTLLQQG